MNRQKKLKKGVKLSVHFQESPGVGIGFFERIVLVEIIRDDVTLEGEVRRRKRVAKIEVKSEKDQRDDF